MTSNFSDTVSTGKPALLAYTSDGCKNCISEWQPQEQNLYENSPGVELDTGQVWLLYKALYGLKQASKEWYLKLKKQLEDLGFKRSNADHRVFTKASGGNIFIIVVYVDVFLLFSELMHEIKEIKLKLKEFFEMKDLEEAKWILQIRIKRSESRLGVRTLLLSQEQYVEEVLERHRMADCNPVDGG